MSREEHKDAIEVSVIFHEGQKMFAVPKQPAQPLPFGVGGGLVAIKTLLSRDPCGHANTAIQMIDAILAEQPAQRKPLPYNKEDMKDLDVNQRLAFKLGWKSAEDAHGIKENT